DGIRDATVTGVQTCALPISTLTSSPWWKNATESTSRECCPWHWRPLRKHSARLVLIPLPSRSKPGAALASLSARAAALRNSPRRSEERRVGKECHGRGGGRR